MKIDMATLGLCLIICVVSSLVTSMVFLGAVDSKFSTIEDKLVEVDGRRNAQYGILKQKIEDK